MRRLTKRLIFMTALIAALTLLASPQRTHANWGECDADLDNRNQACDQQYNDCLSAGIKTPSQCQQEYNSCLDQADALHSTCLHDAGLIDDQWCQQQYNDCMASGGFGCDDTYTSCMSGGSDTTKWPDLSERRRCLQGCLAYELTDVDAYLTCKTDCIAATP
ncbi:MAG: hypothetical protein JOZ02_07775 [Acidobacteria bacterium]|nr:hypothetical protein [Acidobacteriota bacterium]